MATLSVCWFFSTILVGKENAPQCNWHSRHARNITLSGESSASLWLLVFSHKGEIFFPSISSLPLPPLLGKGILLNGFFLILTVSKSYILCRFVFWNLKWEFSCSYSPGNAKWWQFPLVPKWEEAIHTCGFIFTRWQATEGAVTLSGSESVKSNSFSNIGRKHFKIKYQVGIRKGMLFQYSQFHFTTIQVFCRICQHFQMM